MRKPTRPREVGRGERVLPGAWRLRLPLHLPGMPHTNAWALKAGDGVVLVDCGMDERGSTADLERALAQTGHRVEDVALVVVTHAHLDHCGQAPAIAARAGCEVWIHPAYADHADAAATLAHAVEVARQSNVPERPLRRWVEHHPAAPEAPLRSDRDLVEGVEIETDLGVWRVVETPGHAPSHVCLHQPERRLLISGDHLLGRVSLSFDLGHTPDPVGEFLHSLDVVDALDVRLALAGHARPFADIEAHTQANRDLVARRLDAVRAALAGGPRTADEVARAVYGDASTEEPASWPLAKTRAWLTHLHASGEAATAEHDPQRWSLRTGA